MIGKKCKLVFGVGVYERGEFLARSGGSITKEYTLWRGMLERCYSESRAPKIPTYFGCGASENFKVFQFFARWCQSQIGFKEGYHLDKDILFIGNKLYSEDTCVFVPRAVNNLLSSRRSNSGDFPRGASFNKQKKKFQALINRDGKVCFVGWFRSADDAHNAYKKEKEVYVKEVANRYKDSIDPRAYASLIQWEVPK